MIPLISHRSGHRPARPWTPSELDTWVGLPRPGLTKLTRLTRPGLTKLTRLTRPGLTKLTRLTQAYLRQVADVLRFRRLVPYPHHIRQLALYHLPSWGGGLRPSAAEAHDGAAAAYTRRRRLHTRRHRPHTRRRRHHTRRRRRPVLDLTCRDLPPSPVLDLPSHLVLT